MITLIYGHLADYASEGANGKMIVVGIFERVFMQHEGPIQLPICHLAAKLEASLIDGADHRLEVRVVDGNQDPVLPQHAEMPLRFGTAGPGYPLAAQIILQLVGLQLPGSGDWSFELRVDGNVVGNIPFVTAVQPQA
jgi:hypothetical protein